MNIQELPEELRYRIMENLPARDVRSLRGVSRDTRRIAEDETYWKAKLQEKIPFDGSYRQLYNKLNRLYAVTFVTVERDGTVERAETVGVYLSEAQAINTAFEIYLENRWYVEFTDDYIMNNHLYGLFLGMSENIIDDEFLNEFGDNSVPRLLELIVKHRSIDDDPSEQIKQFSKNPLGAMYLNFVKRSFVESMDIDGRFTHSDGYGNTILQINETTLE